MAVIFKNSSFESFIGGSKLFLKTFIPELIDKGLLNDSSLIDHICYKPKEFEEYESLKSIILNAGNTLASEVLINGRPIASFKLKDPIVIGDYTIDCLELPAPKEVGESHSRWDHIEVVIDSDLNEFMAARPAIAWKTSNLNAKINADVSVKLKHGVVKFHNDSLLNIIKEEKKASAAKNSNKAIFFDLDGTLISSGISFAPSMRETMMEYLGKDMSLEYVRSKLDTQYDLLINNFGIPANETNAVLKLFAKKYQNHMETVSLLSGAETLLSVLKSYEYDLYLWTARDEPTSKMIFEKFGIKKYFTECFYYDDITKGKPRLTPRISEILSQKDVLCMVGDSHTDEAAAKAMGVQFYHVSEYDSPEKLNIFLSLYQ